METVRHEQARRPQPRPRKPSQGPLIAGIGLAIGACLLVALIAAYLLLAPPASAALGPSVQINTPGMGEVIAVNVQTPVQASALSDTGVTRIELYADGALVAARDSELPGGNNPAVMFEPWTPLTEGRHILIARSYLTGGGTVDSPAVAVEVVDQLIPSHTYNTGDGVTSINQLAEKFNVTPEEIAGSNPALPPDFDAPIPPGTDVEIPIPPADPPAPEPPPAPLPGSPAPPTNLVVNADCTQATLTWTDAADEQQYKIYRLDAPILSAIATVPAGTTNYVDVLPGLGEYYYQVASVKDGLETLTLLVHVATPPACAPPPAASDLILSMETLVTDAVWDGASSK